MAILDEETREQKTERIVKERYTKQAEVTKKVFKYVFGGLGLFFLAMGLVFLFVDTGDPEDKIVSYIFIPMGAIWLLLGLIMSAVMPTTLNYEKYRQQVEKYGATNTMYWAVEIEVQRAQIEELQSEVDELKKEVDQLKNDRYPRY